MTVTLHCGDALEVMAEMPDSSVDLGAVVCCGMASCAKRDQVVQPVIVGRFVRGDVVTLDQKVGSVFGHILATDTPFTASLAGEVVTVIGGLSPLFPVATAKATLVERGASCVGRIIFACHANGMSQ